MFGLLLAIKQCNIILWSENELIIEGLSLFTQTMGEHTRKRLPECMHMLNDSLDSCRISLMKILAPWAEDRVLSHICQIIRLIHKTPPVHSLHNLWEIETRWRSSIVWTLSSNVFVPMYPHRLVWTHGEGATLKRKAYNEIYTGNCEFCQPPT